MRNILHKIWKKVLSFKSALGFYGDLLVLVLVWWLVKTYVPYGPEIINLVMYLFGALVVFSVLYVVYVQLKERGGLIE